MGTLRIREEVIIFCFLLVLTSAHTFSQQQVPPTQKETDSHLGKGYDALKQERYEDAVREFRAALELDPTLVEKARFPLGVAYFEMRQFDESRRQLEEVRRAVGNHPNVTYYLGRLDLETGDFNGAIRNLAAAAVKPPLPDTAYFLGFAYLQKGELSSAAKWLEVAEKTTPRDSRVPFQLGTVYRKLGRPEEAKKALSRSAELRRRDNDEVQMRVECAQKLDQGPRETARAFCDKLYDPDNAERLTKLGTIYGEHGDVEAALKPLRRAAELAPQSPQMQYNLAYAYFQLNQLEAARPPLETALKRWPDLFQLNALYGAVLFKTGETKLAYQSLSRAHALNPQDTGTTQLLALTAVTLARKNQDAKQFSESLRYLKEAAQLRPDQPEPHRRLAEVYRILGREVDATAEQNEADRLEKP
jgi:tetratricopeptide (TPR) repeat protein